MRVYLLALLLLLGCTSDTPLGSPTTPESPRIWYFVNAEVRSSDGQYKTLDSALHSSLINAAPFTTDFKIDDSALLIEPLSAHARDAEFRVTLGNEAIVKTVIGYPQTEFLFNDGAVRIRLSMESNTLPPLPVGTIKAPLDVFRIDPSNHGAPSIHDYKIVKSVRLATSNNIQRIRNLVETNLYIQLQGADCFEPGMAVNIGTSEKPRYVQICLDCWKIYVDGPETGDQPMRYGLNKSGMAEMNIMYQDLFGK